MEKEAVLPHGGKEREMESEGKQGSPITFTGSLFLLARFYLSFCPLLEVSSSKPHKRAMLPPKP